MRAAVYERQGAAADVLSVREVETPEPGPGEVRVRVAFSGVNPTDWKTRSGATGKLARPFQIPNQDGAGTVDAVGAGVPEARVGERVWVWFAAQTSSYGTAAEYTVVPAEHASPLADGAGFELGAGLGIPAMTAHRCLTADGPLDGLTVLVTGGAGAVGHAAIQLASRLGAARVVATASSEEKRELARTAGAGAVVDYRAADAAERIREAAPDGVDRIVEVALTDNLELDLAVLAPNGSIVSYAAGADPLQTAVRPLMGANATLRFVLVYGAPPAALQEAAREVSAAVADGALTALPEHRFRLDEIAAAHDAVEQGAVGKVLVRLRD